MRISAYIVMNEATLPEASARMARDAGGEWIIANVRGARQLVSCLAPLEMIPALLALLAPYAPVILGVWDQSGAAVAGYPFDAARYLEVAPDVYTDTGADSPSVCARPSVPVDCYQWAGWAPRVMA